MTINSDDRRQLDDDGYLVLPGFIDREMLAALRARILELFELEGDLAGSEFKQETGAGRLANLINKGEVFCRAINYSNLLDYVRHILGPDIKLSSMNARSAHPQSGASQPLHADMGAIMDDRGAWVCNSVWMLDKFTNENGTIRLIPGSHRRRTLPQDELYDPTASHPDEILLTGEAGTVVVMNAHVWHGGLENQTSNPRLAMHAFYARRDKPQQQYQKQLLRPQVQDSLSDELRDLLALDDPLNDELSANPEVTSGFLK